jgi:HEPN domain-containing protein
MTEEAQRWWKDGERDIERARKMFADEDWAGCAFYCQQAVEKWLKALLASRNENAWGHELDKLLSRVREVLGEDLPDRFDEAAEKLTDDYTAARYPDRWESGTAYEHYTKEMAEERMQWASEIREFARSRLFPGTAKN